MSPARAVFLVAFSGMLVSGCASYQPEPLSAAANAQILDSRSLNDPRLLQFVALAGPDEDRRPLRWDLTSLTLAALYYHPNMALSHAKLVEAEAAIITAKELPNPVLNFANIVGQGLVPGAIPAGAAPLTIGPVIDFVLETAGKRESRTSQAQHLADAARYDLATAGWRVRSNVRAALLALWAGQQRVALTKQRLALEDELVQLLEHRLTAGEASSLDVAHERITQSQMTLALHDLDQTIAESRVQLATAIGIPVRALDSADVWTGGFDHPPALPASAENGAWRREALTQRSDLQASLAEYESAQAALRLAIANQYPNITLSPGYTYQYGINQYELNFGTALPIFNQNQGPIAEAVAKRREAAVAFTALQAQIIGSIDQAATAYRSSMKTLASADAMLADEHNRSAQMESSFRAGEIDRPTLVTAQVEAAATALAHLDALVQQRQALGSLEDALQRPLYAPAVMIPNSPESST